MNCKPFSRRVGIPRALISFGTMQEDFENDLPRFTLTITSHLKQGFKNPSPWAGFYRLQIG